MVEGTGLENRRTGNGIVSSNLTLSAAAGAAGVTRLLGEQGKDAPSWTPASARSSYGVVAAGVGEGSVFRMDGRVV